MDNSRSPSFLFILGRVFLFIQQGKYIFAREILEEFVSNEDSSKTKVEVDIILDILPKYDLKSKKK